METDATIFYDYEIHAICHPSRHALTGAQDFGISADAINERVKELQGIPVEGDNVFAPRPEYAPAERIVR